MIATCTTQTCANKGLGIEVGEATEVICGVCGRPTTLGERTTPKPVSKSVD